MTSQDKKEKERRIKKMLERIEDPTRKIADIFKEAELKDCYAILNDYSKNAESHYNSLVQIQKDWKDKILPQINNINCL